MSSISCSDSEWQYHYEQPGQLFQWSDTVGKQSIWWETDHLST